MWVINYYRHTLQENMHNVIDKNISQNRTILLIDNYLLQKLRADFLFLYVI